MNNQKNTIIELQEQMKKIWNILYISNLNSLIINNNLHYNKLLKNWINPNKEIKAELLYRLTRDGEQISKFHELCDNKGPTLTLFHTEDGNKGGLFTPLSWDKCSNWKNDMETFIFNLNKNTKYEKINKELSIMCNSDFGPWVPGLGFKIIYQRRKKEIKSQMKKIHCYGDLNNYFKKGTNILQNNSLEGTFNIKEVEVFKIM